MVSNSCDVNLGVFCMSKQSFTIYAGLSGALFLLLIIIVLVDIKMHPDDWFGNKNHAPNWFNRNISKKMSAPRIFNLFHAPNMTQYDRSILYTINNQNRHTKESEQFDNVDQFIDYHKYNYNHANDHFKSFKSYFRAVLREDYHMSNKEINHLESRVKSPQTSKGVFNRVLGAPEVEYRNLGDYKGSVLRVRNENTEIIGKFPQKIKNVNAREINDKLVIDGKNTGNRKFTIAINEKKR